MRVLIVEDDPDIAEGVAVALKREGHHPVLAHNGIDGERLAAVESFGVILLDLMLPGKPGTEVCKTLRKMDIATPIIMVTARDEVSDRVQGLDCGADDYLVKPFKIEELLARIRAVTRREVKAKRSIYQFGDVELDSVAKIVTKAGSPLHLTHREFELLEALIRNPGRVLTREMILERVWNNDQALPNTVNFHMSSLRKKVDPESKLIKTVHGFGYVMEHASE